MISDIQIEISAEDYQSLLVNLDPTERFIYGSFPEINHLAIYPDGNPYSKAIILKPKKVA